MLEEIVTLSSLIVHKDHMKLDYIPLSARKQQSRFRETQMLPTGLLREEERILLREEELTLLREEVRIALDLNKVKLILDLDLESSSYSIFTFVCSKAAVPV